MQPLRQFGLGATIAAALGFAFPVHAQLGIPAKPGLVYQTIPAFGDPSLPNMQAFGPNDLGQFAVIRYGSGSAVQSFIYDLRTMSAAPVVVPNERATVAMGINNHGTIIAGVGDPTTSALRGVLIEGNTVTRLDNPAEPNFSPRGIANDGFIIGNAHSLSPWFDKVSVYDAGTFTPRDPSGRGFNYAGDINSAGESVGFYYNNNGGFGGAFVAYHHHDGIFEDIVIPGGVSAEGNSISDGGIIAGTVVDASNHPHGYLLEGGLLQSVDYPGATDTWVTGANDNGLIVGFYYTPGATGFQVFTAHPTPDSGSIGLAGLAAMITMGTISRRVRRADSQQTP